MKDSQDIQDQGGVPREGYRGREGERNYSESLLELIYEAPLKILKTKGLV